MSSSDYTEELKNIYTGLEESIKISEQKVHYQHKIYTDLYRIFLKHANKLATVSNHINQEVLQAASQEELTVQHYQVLSNSLLRIADSSRRVSLRLKSEILDPLRTFSENYDNVYDNIKKKFQAKIQELSNQELENQKNREQYNSACEKFERHREGQKKIIEKVERGDKTELEKFNMTTKRLTETITSHEKFYLSSVEKINYKLQDSKKQFAVLGQSISYNEDTRRSFFRKTITNAIRTLQQFASAYDPDVIKKLQEASKIEVPKYEDPLVKKLREQMNRAFVSYDELLKSRRKKVVEEESAHLQQHFSKIKENDKKIMKHLVEEWFAANNKKTSQYNLLPKDEVVLSESQKSDGGDKSPQRITLTKRQSEINLQVDSVKENILSGLPHSLYFVQLLHLRILQMSSFYCKLNEENFYFLLNAFTIITKNMDQNSDLGIEFTYKMMSISQRIMLKKNITAAGRQNNQSIQLLCSKYSKAVDKFRENKFLARLLGYIEKRKASKKKNNNEGKGALNIAKGLLAAFSRSKGPSLSQQQQYNCLQEMIILVSNFSVPNEVILPFIKQALGNANQGTYQYLKNIILKKKDVEQRRSLFYRKEIKEKKEDRIRKAQQNKKMGEYALKLVAEHGYLSTNELQLRTLSKAFKDIHLQILPRLRMATDRKWIHLIPVNYVLDYRAMKQQVAQNSVPSAIEEIITLDVNRSLHLHGESLNPTILHSLLRTYAYFHNDISYCQGMNYLAGYLYIKTRDEESTYRIFEHLMELRFKQIFINEFEVLKMKMYQFERLLTIFHPEISEHFKRQSITPQCYIVSWIITLFASSYQYTLQSYLIDALWERFIIWGWPEFFRFVLWIFSVIKEQLIEMTYDRALHFLGQLGRSELFLSGDQKYAELFEGKYGDPSEGIERYLVSEELLNKFANEYNLDQ